MSPRPQRNPSADAAPLVQSLHKLDDVELRYVELVEQDPAHGVWNIALGLARRWYWLVAAAILGALLGVLVASRQPIRYQASASVELLVPNQRFLSLEDLNPTSSDAQNSFETRMRAMVAGNLRKQVTEQLNLMPFSSPRVDQLPTWWRSVRSVWGRQNAYSQRTGIEMAANTFSVQPVGRTRIVELTCQSTNPAIAAAFVNQLTQVYATEDMQARLNASQHTRDWLDAQVAELKRKLENSEAQLLAYAREANLPYQIGDPTPTEELKRIQQELADAQSERIRKQSKLEVAERTSPEALGDVLDDASLRGYLAQLSDLKRELAQLSETFTAEHYSVRKVQAQIAAMKATLESERYNIVRRIRNDFEGAQRREELVQRAHDNQQKLLQDLAPKAIHLDVLKREVDTNRNVHNALLQKVRESSVASAMKVDGLRVLEPADPPRKPHSPKPEISATFGGLGGLLFAAIVLGLLNLRSAGRFQEPGEVVRFLNLRELGVVPVAKELVRTSSAPGLPFYRKKASQTQSLNLATNSSPAEGRRLPVWDSDNMPAIEAFRGIAASLLFSGRSGASSRVILITSPGPSEGKTSIVANVGVALAELHQRILLIDADIRKPQLHEDLGVSNTWGVSDVLRESMDLHTSPLVALARPTAYPNVWFLPSGVPVTSISRLLHSPRFDQLIARMRNDFDIILIDAPPLLFMTDTRLLARHADAVALVLRADTTTLEEAKAAVLRMEQDGIPLLGTILNVWQPCSRDGVYSSMYNYSRIANYGPLRRHLSGA
jgi:polysaccharide biosynthesis transport protein